MSEKITRELFLIKLLPYSNIPYVWGGEDPNYGLDCSGFIQEAYKILNLDPTMDQTAQGYYEHFCRKSSVVSFVEGADLGDLVFFGNNISHITHVGLALGQGYLMEAAGGGRSTTTPEAAKVQNAKIKIGDINRRKDRVVILRPRDLPWYSDPTKLMSTVHPK